MYPIYVSHDTKGSQDDILTPTESFGQIEVSEKRRFPLTLFITRSLLAKDAA